MPQRSNHSPERRIPPRHPHEIAVDGRIGRVFVMGQDDRTGHLLHTLALGAPPAAVAVDAASGQAFVVVAQEGDDGIRAVDMRSGRVVRTIQAVPAAFLLAVDDRAGRLLVTSAVAPETERPDPWAWIPAGLRSRLPSWLPFIPPLSKPAPSWLPSAGSVGVVDLARS